MLPPKQPNCVSGLSRTSPRRDDWAALWRTSPILSQAALNLAATRVLSRGGRQEVLAVTSAYCHYLRAVVFKDQTGFFFLSSPPDECSRDKLKLN